MREQGRWPAVPPTGFHETCATLHMCTQIAGKICLALTPRTNHFWNIAFQVTPRGLATPPMPYGDGAFTITFDLVSHQCLVACSQGATASIRLEPRDVADFYRLLMQTLHDLGISVRIWTMPVEVPNPIRFEEDRTHHEYDPVAANAFLRMLLTIKP